MIKYLLFLHIVFGSLALSSGTIIMFLKKGTALHKKFGKVYGFSGLLGTLFSLFISSSESHFNIFLFLIGLFTLYFLASGLCAFRINKKGIKILAIIMIVISLIMIGYAIYLGIQKNYVSCIILLFFGILGILNAYLVDIKRLLKNSKDLLSFDERLVMHITKVIGSYLAMLTAFVVVNNIFFYKIINWLLPALLGGFLIRHFLRKHNGK